MHISNALRDTARATLIDRWAHEGFKVPARHNATFRMLWELAGLSDEVRQRIGIVSNHEAQLRSAPYYPSRSR
jgi:hypothetical protein